MSRDFEFQCEGIYGLTGSGKTTFAMMRAFEMASKGLHVYTNIEFSRDALRHHLLRKAGQHLRTDDDRIPRLHRLFHHIPSDDVGEFWKHVAVGPAVVIIDEAQLWFPQSSQHKGERKEFVTYLTQHRKLKHHVWLISQFPTLVSHNFRKMQHTHWEVRNSRQRAIGFGIFTVRCPFEGFFYVGYHHNETGERVASQTILACLPGNKWIWDLFDSRELHAGLGSLVKQGGEHAAV
jgi:hypothetical protein